MYLKALEIQGFKSFPEKTRLTFEKDITAIVGPNGSGKSNISDAILWVMGEQRTKALRGGKMEDVIFGGTEKRSAMGFAQVSLILDNSSHIFDTDNTEVMITRRYYRSGESEYYINRESVRLKDINELLMDTGLGRDGYSIIGQGRIADIVSAKSEDRREIFEEAAGISRYRYRKEESERKLQRTDENLLRIHDKIDELELQVEPLRKQAETAKRYLVLRDELRVLEVSLWMENLDRLHAQAETVAADYASAKNALDAAKAEQERLYAEAENLSAKMRECDVEAESARETLSQAEAGAAECDSAIAVLRANLKHNFENMDRIQTEMAEQAGRAKSLEGQIEARRQRVAEIETRRAELELAIREALRRAEENASGTDETMREIARLLARENEGSDALTQSRTMLSMLADTAQELMDRETAIAAETAQAEEKRAALRVELDAAQKEHTAAQERLAEIQNIISGHKLLMAGREKKVQDLSDRHTRLTIDCKSMDSRIHMLTEMEKEFEGFSKAVKTVMRERERGTLRGVHGPVGTLLKTDDRFALAIETALGAAVQNIVVDTQEDGKAAIELLKRRDGGRGTFLPLRTIRGSMLRRVPQGEEGFLGVAVDLVRFDAKYAEVFSNLLGRTVVTETLSDAVRLSKKYDNQLRIVTLDGQLINAGGSMTGGSTAKGVGILSRAGELKRLAQEREKLGAEMERCAAALTEAQRVVRAAKYEVEVAASQLTEAQEAAHKWESQVSQYRLLLSATDEALDDLDDEKGSVAARIRENRARIEGTKADAAAIEQRLNTLREESAGLAQGREAFERRREELSARLSELRAAMASLDAEREATQQAIAQMDELRHDLSGDSGARQRTLADIEVRNRDIEAELELKENRLAQFTERINGLKSNIGEITRLKLELEGKRTGLDKASQEKNRELLDMERLCAGFEQKRLAAEMEEKQIIDKLWDSYELSHSAAQAARQPVESVQKTGRRVGEIRREISALGTPNLGAIEEYERVSERYTFLSEQRDDVEKAKRELLAIISDITAEMKEIFTREFKAIDESFRQTFLELFGGGRAALVLEDEENVLDCGIEIKAQPPGKALSKISLMSGGEKAFVAIALYFAILKVRPTPFCVMDEIEAALDEANVTRFADYMRTIADKTQFLVITHRRGTMEEADMLYGVTMQEKGISKVIDLDLEQAEKTIA